MALFDDWQAIVVVISLAGGIVASFFKDKLIKQKEQSDETIARVKDVAALRVELLKEINEHCADNERCLRQIEKDLNNVATRFDIIWKVVEQQLPKVLKQR